MGAKTEISWADSTWNPVTGCERVSPGCDRCYAEAIATRFAGTKAYPDGFAVTLHPERLDQPLRWRDPRRVFVCSMSDLFHPDVPDDYIADVFDVMACHGPIARHTFQVLTKRPQRMAALLGRWAEEDGYVGAPNVWLGVSVENQRYADLRIPYLLDTPASVRFVSAEPLLGPVDLARYLDPTDPTACGDPEHCAPMLYPSALDWVIVGGESGPGARPMHPAWARALRDQCAGTGVAFHYKQTGAWKPYDLAERGHAPGICYLHHDGTVHEAPGPWHLNDGSGCTLMERVGAKAAGHELGGQTYQAFPD